MKKITNIVYFVKEFSRLLHSNERGGSKRILNMPKQVQPKDTLRHIKYKSKRGGKLPVSGIIDLVVIGNGTAGCPRCVMVTTSINRYLFNCGEGTQRMTTEHRSKISRLANIFITHKSWDNIGGLHGMALTLQGIGVPEVSLHGPPGVDMVISEARSFSMLTTLKCARDDSELFEDNTLTIQTVPIYRDGDSKTDPAYVYLCTPKPALRKLDMEKALDLRIPRGPVLGKLKDGLEVTLDDGRVIKPDQVLSDAEPNMPFFVLECPSHDHIDSLVNNPKLAAFQNQSEPTIDVIVHMTSGPVMADERYQKWMKGFGPQTKHLMINETNDSLCHKALYRIQAKLNQLSSSIFPLLPNQVAKDKLKQFEESISSNILPGYSGMRHKLRPRGEPDSSQCVYTDNDSFTEECTAVEGFSESLQQMKTALNKVENGCQKSKPEVVFLGTGSAIPSKERNVSSILLNISNDSSMLLDCGEGTCGQLHRFYGKDFDDIICRIKAVFISHMHADHHLGLFGILEARRKAFAKRGLDPAKLFVIGPVFMFQWLDNVNNEVQPVWPYVEFISIHHIVGDTLDDKRVELFQECLRKLQLTQVSPVRVRHCKHAFGLVVNHTDGWKIVYSGDTMPCDALVEAGKDCDLLIHEATMEDDMLEDAILKTHSTTSQAIDIGMRMNAGFILLNHFSQRYAKIPLINDKFCNKVGISFDNMRVSLQDLPILPHFFPTLKLMFQEHYTEMEDKLYKRTVKRKLEEEELEAKNVKKEMEAMNKTTS